MCSFSGYSGRTGIYELLELEDNIKEMIISKRSPFEVRKKAVEKGMTSLREDCRYKVIGGITTIEEMNRVTFY
jgi:type IV pilus assembly protein PilB